MDYVALAQNARERIARFGTSAAILVTETTPPDPERPWEGGGSAIVAYPCDAFVSSFTTLELAVTGISADAVKILVSANGLSIEPGVFDLLTLTGQDRQYNIGSVRAVRPGGVLIYWEISAR